MYRKLLQNMMVPILPSSKRKRVAEMPKRFTEQNYFKMYLKLFPILGHTNDRFAARMLKQFQFRSPKIDTVKSLNLQFFHSESKSTLIGLTQQQGLKTPGPGYCSCLVNIFLWCLKAKLLKNLCLRTYRQCIWFIFTILMSLLSWTSQYGRDKEG